MGIKKYMKNNIIRVMDKFGYNCQITKKKYKIDKNTVAINVGAGAWSCPGWINYDYPSEWYSKLQKKNSFKVYDMRNDNLPFENDKVDLIYCSHVIEHIEDHYVERFLKDSFRVLKKGGVIRISCPDADYIYDMTKISKDYWNWNKNNFENYGLKFEDVQAVDILVHQLSTKRFLDYRDYNIHEYVSLFDKVGKEDFFQYITKDIVYDKTMSGIHINFWTFQKLSNLLKKIGFKTVIKSRYLGSSRPEMQDPIYFDITSPQDSLYVEAIK